MLNYMNRGGAFYRQVGALAAPIVLQNLITSALGMADTFMVGLLGQLPMAAVTLANIPLFVVQLFIFGVQSGSTVLFSQYWGRRDTAAINRVMGVAFLLAGAVSLTVALVLLAAPVRFLSLFGNDPQVVTLAAEYGRIAGFSWFLDSFAMIYIAAYRSMEKPKLGMYILIASVTCNTLLNWVLIFGKLGAPAMGVAGAALATLISRGLELVIVIFHASFSRGFRLDFPLLLRPGLEMTRRFVRYGAPVVGNETLWGLGTSMFPTIMGHMAGSQDILAAYTIAGNVERLCQVVAMGIAATASIIIGREIGAGRKHLVYQVGLTMNTLAVLAGLVVGALLLAAVYLLFPVFVFPLFSLTENAQTISTMMLTVLALVMVLRDFNTVNVVGVLRGGGDVTVTTLIDLSPLWLVAIPAAAVTAGVLKLSISWVYLAMSAEQAVKFALGVWRLRSGKWVRDVTREDV
ncbi:MAG: MATE family efflux transporter [Clostridium sp.]|nr:MATE family efflux transporter [Clostridium sp.]